MHAMVSKTKYKLFYNDIHISSLYNDIHISSHKALKDFELVRFHVSLYKWLKQNTQAVFV